MQIFCIEIATYWYCMMDRHVHKSEMIARELIHAVHGSNHLFDDILIDPFDPFDGASFKVAHQLLLVSFML